MTINIENKKIHSILQIVVRLLSSYDTQQVPTTLQASKILPLVLHIVEGNKSFHYACKVKLTKLPNIYFSKAPEIRTLTWGGRCSMGAAGRVEEDVAFVAAAAAVPVHAAVAHASQTDSHPTSSRLHLYPCACQPASAASTFTPNI